MHNLQRSMGKAGQRLVNSSHTDWRSLDCLKDFLCHRFQSSLLLYNSVCGQRVIWSTKNSSGADRHNWSKVGIAPRQLLTNTHPLTFASFLTYIPLSGPKNQRTTIPELSKLVFFTMTSLRVLQTLLYLPVLYKSLPPSSSYKRESYEREKDEKRNDWVEQEDIWGLWNRRSTAWSLTACLHALPAEPPIILSY